MRIFLPTDSLQKSLLKGVGLKSEKSVIEPKLFGGRFESFFSTWKSLLKGAGLKSEKSVIDPKLFGGRFESFFDLENGNLY